MSSAVNAFVHAICKPSKKCLAHKVVPFGLCGPIPMIQLPLASTLVALQYEPGTKFFHRAAPEIRSIQNQVNSVQLRGLSLCLLSAWLLIMKNGKRTGILCVHSRF